MTDEQPQAAAAAAPVRRINVPELTILARDRIRVAVTLLPIEVPELWFELLSDEWGDRPFTWKVKDKTLWLAFECTEAEVKPCVDALDGAIVAANDAWRDEIAPMNIRLREIQESLRPKP